MKISLFSDTKDDLLPTPCRQKAYFQQKILIDWLHVIPRCCMYNLSIWVVRYGIVLKINLLNRIFNEGSQSIKSLHIIDTNYGQLSSTSLTHPPRYLTSQILNKPRIRQSVWSHENDENIHEIRFFIGF